MLAVTTNVSFSEGKLEVRHFGTVLVSVLCTLEKKVELRCLVYVSATLNITYARPDIPGK